jgi:hypothetical protein
VGPAGAASEAGESPFTSTQIRAHSDAIWSIVPRGGASGDVLCVGADGFVSFVDVHAFLRNSAAGSPSNGVLQKFAFESQVSASTPNPTAAVCDRGWRVR